MQFDFSTIAFFIFSLIAISGALGVATNRNLFRGIIWLIVSLFGVAGLFVLLSAPFLAAVQILVYIGAIAILFTFAVMLTRSLTRLTDRFNRLWPSAIVSGLFFVLLVVGVIWPVWGSTNAYDVPASDVVRTTVDLGVVLLAGEGFVLPFEVASLLLTAAMIGAIVIARDADEEEERQ